MRESCQLFKGNRTRWIPTPQIEAASGVLKNRKKGGGLHSLKTSTFFVVCVLLSSPFTSVLFNKVNDDDGKTAFEWHQDDSSMM